MSAYTATASSSSHPARRRLLSPLRGHTCPVIRHDDFGALVSAAFFGKRVVVSPSGTRGVGSTKVRAGRRQTLG